MSRRPVALLACRARPAAARGFTLVEALIAIAVVALLAAIALPAYQDAVRKSRRSDAYDALARVQQAQERWRSNRSSYTTELTAAPSADPPGLGQSATSAKGYYAISIPAADAVSYEIVATATAGKSQADDTGCQRLRIRVAGGNVFYGAAAGGGEFDESATNRCWSR